jgi:hypothetical protein
MSSYFRVILHLGTKTHAFGWGRGLLRNQPGGLADLHGLSPPLSAELVK